MLKISQKFFGAVKLANRPAYRIALDAGLHPVTLSKILHGYDRIWPNDHRVIAVAKVLGLKPDECFERESADDTNASVD
ncbi:MAG: helix-turn-helix domain-containing protein [Thermodesulfobacteriota bacterium]|jgi:lambda repressor-like predicted transcriptional regulator